MKSKGEVKDSSIVVIDIVGDWCGEYKSKQDAIKAIKGDVESGEVTLDYITQNYYWTERSNLKKVDVKISVEGL